MLLAAALLAFAVLLTVSERFFCPALELISDYLKLPPVVAGATLLSFGNGAPDTFTQVAAVGQVTSLGRTSFITSTSSSMTVCGRCTVWALSSSFAGVAWGVTGPVAVRCQEGLS